MSDLARSDQLRFEQFDRAIALGLAEIPWPSGHFQIDQLAASVPWLRQCHKGFDSTGRRLQAYPIRPILRPAR